MLEELGYILDKSNAKNVIGIGTFEHFYKDNFLCNSNFSTHYLVLAYLIPHKLLIRKTSKMQLINNQHSEYAWLNKKKLKSFKKNIHPNTLSYLKNKYIKKIINS